MRRLHGAIPLIILLAAGSANAGHLHPERFYQQAWCDQAGGQTEVVLDDRTRVDCLTETHAVEVDFAPKWAESVGQSLYYGMKTGKRPGVLLILERPSDQKHLDRLRALAARQGIEIWSTRSEEYFANAGGGH